MKIQSLFVITAIALLQLPAFATTAVIDPGNLGELQPVAGSCSSTTCPSGNTVNEFALCAVYAECTLSSKTCYTSGGKTYYKQDCVSCPAGYTMTNISTSCSNITCRNCECICSNCEPQYNVTNGTGYLKDINRYCSCSTGVATCKSSTTYKCAAGYYGTTSNGTSGCTKCPSGPNGETTTSAVNNNSTIAKCYIPSGTTGSDGTGSFKYSPACYQSDW